MEKGLVSIIVPVYNSNLYLDECLESIINQTYKFIEIILVNDGSTDNSQEICNHYARKDNRVTVISQSNKGVVLARKQGIRNAHGEYITFIDSDDYIAKDYIQTMLNNIGDSDMVTSALILKDRIWEDEIDEGIYDISFKSEVINNMIYKKGTSKNGLVTHITIKLFRTDIVKKMMDTVDDYVYYGEDAEFVYKYILRCNKVTITKYKGYYYRENESSITHVVHDDFLISVNRMYLSLKEDFEKSQYKDQLIPQLEKWINMHIRIAPKKMGFIIDNINYIIPCKAQISNRNIIVYGAGNVGKDYIRQIIREKLCIDYIWVDKNYALKEEWMGVNVSSLDDVMDYPFDYVIIAVYNEKVMYEIKEELVELGIDIQKIIAMKPLSIHEFYV